MLGKPLPVSLHLYCLATLCVREVGHVAWACNNLAPMRNNLATLTGLARLHVAAKARRARRARPRPPLRGQGGPGRRMRPAGGRGPGGRVHRRERARGHCHAGAARCPEALRPCKGYSPEHSPAARKRNAAPGDKTKAWRAALGTRTTPWRTPAIPTTATTPRRPLLIGTPAPAPVPDALTFLCADASAPGPPRACHAPASPPAVQIAGSAAVSTLFRCYCRAMPDLHALMF